MEERWINNGKKREGLKKKCDARDGNNEGDVIRKEERETRDGEITRTMYEREKGNVKEKEIEKKEGGGNKIKDREDMSRGERN